jgi:MFS superfamily sulfate permease-like transporter
MHFYQKGASQFLPFIITISAILLTDLLLGMAIGMAFGLFFVIKANYQAAITLSKDGSHYLLSFNKDVSFLNKAVLRKFILSIDENSHVTVDTTKAEFMDHDILETIEDFLATTLDDNIRVEFIEIDGYQRFSGIGEKHN